MAASGPFAQDEPGNASRQHPDDDNDGDEEAYLARQLAFPGGHRRPDEAQDHTGRRGPDENISSAGHDGDECFGDELGPHSRHKRHGWRVEAARRPAQDETLRTIKLETRRHEHE